jgi:hypothetical protein
MEYDCGVEMARHNDIQTTGNAITMSIVCLHALDNFFKWLSVCSLAAITAFANTK